MASLNQDGCVATRSDPTLVRDEIPSPTANANEFDILRKRIGGNDP